MSFWPSRIRVRAIMLSGLAVGLMVSAAGTAVLVETTLLSSLGETQTVSTALRNHTVGDMVHDGLRSSVFAALTSAEVGTAPEKVREELDHYVEEFNRVYRENKALPLDPAIRAALDSVDQPLKDYIATTRRVVELALTDRPAALAELPLFEEKFEALEKAMDEVGDNLESKTQEISQRAAGFAARATLVNRCLLVSSFLAIALLAFYVLRGMLTPLLGLKEAMRAMSIGNLDTAIPATARGDEIGEMARTLEVFRTNLAEADRMRDYQNEERERAVEAKQQEMQRLADTFQATVGQIIQTVSGSARRLEEAAAQLNTSAIEAHAGSTTVADASDNALTNVRSVVAATGRLTTSVAEIGRQVSESANIAQRAVDRTRATDTLMKDLAGAADQIGDVIGFINAIARQTNLLALNATIEAARAGEAGKGFAVVAQEVKSLAEQTSKATGDISHQIGGIQEAARRSAEAIREITAIIGQVSDIAAVISDAVTEQGAATSEINRSIEEAARSAGVVTGEVGRVTESAEQTGDASRHVLGAARMLSQQSEALSGEVETFLKTVRAA